MQAADEVKLAAWRREFVAEWEPEHDWSPDQGLIDLVAISKLMCERAYGPERPARPKLMLIRGGRDA
jgi:hypothetical protein